MDQLINLERTSDSGTYSPVSPSSMARPNFISRIASDTASSSKFYLSERTLIMASFIIFFSSIFEMPFSSIRYPSFHERLHTGNVSIPGNIALQLCHVMGDVGSLAALIGNISQTEYLSMAFLPLTVNGLHFPD